VSLQLIAVGTRQCRVLYIIPVQPELISNIGATTGGLPLGRMKQPWGEMGRWGDGESGLLMPDARCPMPDARCPMPDALLFLIVKISLLIYAADHTLFWSIGQ